MGAEGACTKKDEHTINKQETNTILIFIDTEINIIYNYKNARFQSNPSQYIPHTLP